MRGYTRPTSALPQFGVFFVLALLYSFAALHAEAACDGVHILNGTYVVAEINGSKTLVYARNADGSRALDFLNATLSFDGFSERTRTDRTAANPAGICDPQRLITDEPDRLYYRYTEELDCNLASGHYFQSDARVDYFTLNYTDPALPGFWLATTWASTTQEFTIRPSENTTFVDPGQEYVWTYRPESIKITIEAANYPWFGSNAPLNTSFMMFHWSTQARLMQVNAQTYDGAYEGYIHFDQAKGSVQRSLNMTFEKSFMVDEVPIMQADPTALGTVIDIKNWTIQSYHTPFLTAVPFCTSTHWQRLSYDPTVLALFGSDATSSAPLSPTARKNNHLAGILVGSILGSIVVIVVAVVLLAIFVKPVRNFFRPFAARKDVRHKNTLESSTSAPTTDQSKHNTLPGTPTRTGAWERSTRPSA